MLPSTKHRSRRYKNWEFHKKRLASVFPRRWEVQNLWLIKRVSSRNCMKVENKKVCGYHFLSLGVLLLPDM